MKSLSISSCVVLFVAATFVLSSTSHAQFEEAARWVPQSANTITLVRNKEILESQIGQKENWLSSRSQAYRAGNMMIPPSMRYVMLASQMDLDHFTPMYNVGYFQSTSEIDLNDVSKRIGGNLEMIGEKNAVVLPNNTYLVKMDDQILVTMAPASRQMTTRWMSNAMTNTNRIPPYLQQAIEFADSNADIIIALDVEGMISKERATEGLKKMDSIDQSFVDLYATTIASLKGVTLGVVVNDKVTGSIKFDFEKSPAGMVTNAKAIFLAILKNHGSMIDDFESWEISSGENQLRLTGPLSSTGLGQLTSLVSQPLIDDFAYSGSDSGVADSNMATVTKQYFGDVQHQCEILRNRDLEQLKSYEKWFNRAAQKIDALSVLNVDPAMVDYGNYVANAFRDVTGSLRNSDYQRASNQSQQLYRGGVQFSGYGYWGGGSVTGNYNTRYNDSRNARMASNLGTMKGFNDATEITREIEEETAKIRQEMTEKYKINF